MRIASWNINGVRARIDYIKLWLEERQPDLVGFQEIKATEDNFPVQEFLDVGYQVHIHGQKSFNGVAFAAKENMEVSQVGLPGQEEGGARLIVGQFGDITYGSVYCPNGKTLEHPDYEKKLVWFESLHDFCKVEIEKGRDFLIGGDYNICASAQDSHYGSDGDGKIFHTDRERTKLNALFELGLVDLFRHKHPDSDAFSWWDYRAGAFQRNLGLRIDLLLGTNGIVDRTTEVTIDRDYRKKHEGLTASDHAPVYVDLSV